MAPSLLGSLRHTLPCRYASARGPRARRSERGTSYKSPVSAKEYSCASPMLIAGDSRLVRCMMAADIRQE